MQVYGTNLHPAWVALCCTPVVGTTISFIGTCKWGNEASMLPDAFAEKQKAFEAARAAQQSSHNRDKSLDMPGSKEGYFEEVVRKQAIYAVTSVVSSIFSLALMVQNAANPIFQICVAWTGLYAIGAYLAVRQVAQVEKPPEEDAVAPVFPTPVSFAVPIFRGVYSLV